MNPNEQKYLLGLDLQELRWILEEEAEGPSYRARQLFHALYAERVSSADDISTLPKEFRAALIEKGIAIGLPNIQKKFLSRDGTTRYLVQLSDGETVETVWMPDGDDGEAGDGSDAGGETAGMSSRAWGRATICVSSQVGCAVNCQFCLTALLGVKRNLTAGEIVGQVIAVLREQKVDLERTRMNIVFMGQGEPFHNYDQSIKSVRLLMQGA